jgi:hypothetical protein
MGVVVVGDWRGSATPLPARLVCSGLKQTVWGAQIPRQMKGWPLAPWLIF